MQSLFPRNPFFRGGFALLMTAHLLGACGGQSSSVSGGDDDDPPKGGSSGATGSVGGSGANVAANGGTGGPAPSCGGVVCGPLPTTCKQIVQPPDACCPICKDTGCDPCAVPDCEPGSHAETAAGDCCPTCVPDPLDPCEQGRAAYSGLREGLLEKYSSLACKNSSECGLVMEDNACMTVTCPVALPTLTIENYTSNLNALTTACSSCKPAGPPELCEPTAAACVNGLCATTSLR